MVALMLFNYSYKVQANGGVSYSYITVTYTPITVTYTPLSGEGWTNIITVDDNAEDTLSEIWGVLHDLIDSINGVPVNK